MACIRRFWVKEPRHSEAISREKCNLYRSTRPVGSCYLCRCPGPLATPQVFVLTQSKEADQKQVLQRVQKLALDRCGSKVEVAPWLAGRLALDEFLDNHRRVLDLIVRHRLSSGMW